MSDEFKLQAELRTDTGKGASRRLRKESKIPAIIYGGKNKPQNIKIAFKDMIKALEDQAFYSQVLSLEVDGKAQKVVLRDLQRHPSRGEPAHADFLRVSAKQKITMVVPLHFINEETCVGVKEQGGELLRNAAEVEIIALPKDLPEFIAVDLAAVKLGETLHLSSLSLPKGVEIVVLAHGADYDQPVVSVHKPKGETADEAADAEAASAASTAAAAEEKKEG